MRLYFSSSKKNGATGVVQSTSTVIIIIITATATDAINNQFHHLMWPLAIRLTEQNVPRLQMISIENAQLIETEDEKKWLREKNVIRV